MTTANPTPYYTATGTAEVATAGPADPGAGTRAKLYSGLALLTPLLSFLATFGIFTGDQANALVGVSTAVVGALSAFGFGLAAKKTTAQVANGTFQPAPANPVADAFQAIDAIAAHAADTKAAAAVSGVADALGAIQSAVSLLPGGNRPDLGGLANLLPGPVGDLVQDLADRGGKL